MSIRKTLVAVTCTAFAVLGTAGTASALGSGSGGASAVGVAGNSPGILSGDVIQVPISLDPNLCGNTIDIIGLLNPAAGNTCVNQ